MDDTCGGPEGCIKDLARRFIHVIVAGNLLKGHGDGVALVDRHVWSV